MLEIRIIAENECVNAPTKEDLAFIYDAVNALREKIEGKGLALAWKWDQVIGWSHPGAAKEGQRSMERIKEIPMPWKGNKELA